MLALLYIFIFITIGVSFWQITRVLNLRGVIATDNDNNTQGKIALVFLVFLYSLMIYTLVAWNYLLLPEAASLEGETEDILYMVTFILIGVVQFGMQFLIFYFTNKYKGRKDRKALFYSDSHKLETIWTVIPALTIVILIGFGLVQWTDVTNFDKEDNPLLVEVYAKQFAWQARYAGEDNELGYGNVRFIKGLNTLGVDMSDITSKDDKQVTELKFPVGRKILFKFRSQDVLHSAYMPHFRAQMNCVPGMVTQFQFTPKMTTLEMRKNEETIKKVNGINKIRLAKGEDPYEFDYLLLCNKICGASHYNMQMKITIVSPKEYEEWINKQKTLAQILKK